MAIWSAEIKEPEKLYESEFSRDRGTEPLKGIIDKLNKEKKVPSQIIACL